VHSPRLDRGRADDLVAGALRFDIGGLALLWLIFLLSLSDPALASDDEP
jgi:hypothetical protein